jgi:anti-sigma factor RsiW
MTERQADATELLLQAALDGELDAAGMIEVEAKLAADPALAAEYARLAALRAAIARRPRERAPDALRARVIAMAKAPAAPLAPTAARRPSRLRDPRFRALAASLLLGVVLGAGGFGMLTARAPEDEVQRAIVDGYVRGRLSSQPVDVVTSDRHTVKPWLAGKVTGATTVVDLKADGFPLVGGRIDVVGGTPVATLVYQRREHQIALSEIPAGSQPASEPRRSTRAGYALVEWNDGGRLYAAVSDLPPAELDAFCAAFRRAAAVEREEAPKP